MTKYRKGEEHQHDETCTHPVAVKPRGRPKKTTQAEKEAKFIAKVESGEYIPIPVTNTTDDIEESVVPSKAFKANEHLKLLDEISLLDAKIHHENRSDWTFEARFIIDECRRKLKYLVDEHCQQN